MLNLVGARPPPALQFVLHGATSARMAGHVANLILKFKLPKPQGLCTRTGYGYVSMYTYRVWLRVQPLATCPAIRAEVAQNKLRRAGTAPEALDASVI